MYIPSFNQFTDKQDVIAFIKRYNFATIVTVDGDIPVATHLPFLVNPEDENKINLLSHFAKANHQGNYIDGRNALVIFMEPHAYISPRNYEKLENVPTWNYIAVHAYGKCSVINDLGGKADLLKNTILNYEQDYLHQWNNLTDDYRAKMINGITAFKMEVYDLQAKMKLSQNRSEKEKEHIIAHLSQQQNASENEIARYMSLLKDK